MEKYFVVHPKGGFIDCMSVVDICLEYAIKYNRKIVIDVSGSQLNVDIQQFIMFNHPNIHVCNLNEFYESIKELTVYPNEIKGRINTYSSKYINGIYTHVTNTNKHVSMKIDLTIDYEEDVIVYGHCRNGSIGTIIFKHLKFADFIMEEYKRRIAKLPTEYISFHIRNTDYKSDVAAFIEKYKEKMSMQQFFLASDNTKDIENIKEQFGNNVYTFSTIENKGRPIHFVRNKPEEYKKQNFIDSICDLLILAGGKEFYHSNRLSGYSQMANYLNKNNDALKLLTQ